MKYFDYVQKEVVRYYGNVNWLITRETAEDNYLNGIPMKKGTVMSLNWFGNHFNPKYFKDPMEFRPERWESECSNLPPYVMGGFSGGARTCIGKNLALL